MNVRFKELNGWSNIAKTILTLLVTFQELWKNYFFLTIQIPVFGVRSETSDLRSNQLTEIVALHIASFC